MICMRKLRIIIIFSLVLYFLPTGAQTINMEKTILTNYLVRMYEDAPFDGARIVKDGEQVSLISVVRITKSKYNSNNSVMDRIATIKAQSQASQLLNGTQITLDMIINMDEDVAAGEELIEVVTAKSVGHINSLELLTSFEELKDNNIKAYIFYKEM